MYFTYLQRGLLILYVKNKIKIGTMSMVKIEIDHVKK